MLQEADFIPFHISPPVGERALILSPHPDDETLGCGGAIRLLVETGKAVKVIFLTSGDKADPSHYLSHRVHQKPHVTDYSALREKEAEKALRVLGVKDYEFMRFPDRGLSEHYGEALAGLCEIAADFLPDTVYSPSMIELNPDHRAAAALAMDLQRTRASLQESAGVVFYEVSTPLRPNMLVDITSSFGKKKKAMKKYRSQLRLINYLGHMTALNTFRSLTVKGSSYIEAFWVAEHPLSDEEIRGWLCYGEILTLGDNAR
jgi:LmbE family N-acetylglucosaminyl deacetylase